MKLRTVFLSLAACIGSNAAGIQGFQALSSTRPAMADRAQVASSHSVAVWLWTDKYVYKPGEPVTVRWTAKANGDPTPYTAFIYRQNNQSGQKYFFPAGTEEATDFTGKTAAEGYSVVQAGSVSKAVLIGSGGLFPAITAPDDLGMHTVAVQFRDADGADVIKTAYVKFGVVSEQVAVNQGITSDTTWTSSKSYLLRGVITVANNATLTIEPGTIVMGAAGSQPPSVLMITRNGKINAKGTRSRPIIMTSAQPFGQRKRGDWGGMLVLGKAPINVGANISSGICSGSGGCKNAKGTFYIEGLVANEDGLYGGDDPNHSCGTMQYMRIEYAGSILSPANETNSFTWGGCGKNTVADHLQAIYGADDSFEWFGGSMDAKYLVGGLGADDYVDFQLGYTGRIQFGLFYQSPDALGNRGIEGDNSEYGFTDIPVSNPTMYNLTFVGSGKPGYDEGNAPGIFLRRGSRGSFNNIVVTNFNSAAMELNDAATREQGNAGNIIMNGILAWNDNLGISGAKTINGQISEPNSLAYAQSKAKNVMVADPLMARPFEFSDPDWRPVAGSPLLKAGWVSPPDDGFFDQSATFIGGIGDENWTEEWTSFIVESDIAQ